MGRDGGRGGDAERALFGLEFGGGQDGIEVQRRRDAVGDVKLVDLVVTFGLIFKCGEHHLAIVGGDGNIGDGGGPVDHIGCDFFLAVGERPEDARKKRGCETQTRAGGDKAATIEHSLHLARRIRAAGSVLQEAEQPEATVLRQQRKRIEEEP